MGDLQHPDQMNAALLRSIATEMEQQPLDDLTDAERAHLSRRWFEWLVAEGYNAHQSRSEQQLENNHLWRRVRALEAELIELRQAEIARHEAKVTSRPDAEFADQVSELFSWLARIVDRYGKEFSTSDVGNLLFGHLIFLLNLMRVRFHDRSPPPQNVHWVNPVQQSIV
jgi:hypothetical protein